MQAGIHKWVTILCITGAVACFLIFLYYPAVPTSTLGWAILIFLGIPAWLFLEWLGELVLGMRFFSRLSRAARIAIAVPVVILLIAVGMLLLGLVQALINHT
jgi:hypothetical protein